MKAVEFANWFLLNERGQRSRTSWKMTQERALGMDPTAYRDEFSVEIRMCPESLEEWNANSSSAFMNRAGGLRIIVCGGRSFSNEEALFRALDKLHQTRGIADVIHGAAPGADSLADQWAQTRFIRRYPCPADWKTYGKRAGPLRNAHMLTLSPNGVVAFPGGRGTLDMVRQAEAAGIKVWRPFG